MSRGRFSVAVSLIGLALIMSAPPSASAGAAAARSCEPAIPDAYDLRAKNVSCKVARKVSRASFDKIGQCLNRGQCSVGRWHCDPRPAKNPPPGLAGGRMICKKGEAQKVTYGYGG